VLSVTAKSKDGEEYTSEVDYEAVGPPEATITSPANGTTVAQGESAQTSFNCTEGVYGTGLASCEDSNGAQGREGTLNTSQLGEHEYTVTAKSKDGQEGTAKISYTVAKAQCTTSGGTVTLSPGLTDTPMVQTMKIKGTLTSCSGDTVTATTYTATLTTEGAVSCPVLKGAGEPGSGSAQYKWTPKTKSSTGTLSLPLTETEVALSGAIATGPYSPLTLSGTASEKYTGGMTCGEKVGKKAAKAVKKGTFTGSAVDFE
jgi:hypothetical protein